MAETGKDVSGGGLPSLEQSLSATASREAVSGNLEQTVAAAETSSKPAGSVPAGVAPALDPVTAVVLPPIPAIANDAGALPTPSPAVDDNDDIEKDWVSKAKQIVESTRDDPYKQSEDLTIFKADYMKKRYGKNIKLSQ